MARPFVLLLALVSLVPCVFAPAAAHRTAAAAPAPPVARLADAELKADPATAVPARSAGTIEGLVTAIDYRSSTMSVVAGARRVDITILPSTNIQGANNAFRTIADIAKGSHVRVLLSQRAGTYTAQIITLH